MYQQLMLDVHRQWLQEFDREQAIRRQLPRRGERRGPGLLALLRRRRRRPQVTRALASESFASGALSCSGYRQAQQCA